MAQVNRDKESIYAPGRLNLWFLGTSVLLVGAIVWMMADDYIRPWRPIQRAFYERHATLLEIKKEQDEGAIRAHEKSSTRLRELSAAIAAAQRDLERPETAKKLAQWEADAKEQVTRIGEAERDIKAIKGKYSERRYQYELALRYGKKDEAASIGEVLSRLGSDQVAKESDLRESTAEKERIVARLAAERAKLKALQDEREKLLEAVSKTATSLKDARGKFAEDQWRNLPIAEIVAPTQTIEKVVIDDIHNDYVFATSPKVDMCMTCHRGIDRELLSEPEVRPLLGKYLAARLGALAWETLSTNEKYNAKWVEHTDDAHLRGWLSGRPSLLDVFTKTQIDEALAAAEQQSAAESTPPRAPRAPDAVKRSIEERHLHGKKLDSDGAVALLAPFAIRRVEWAHPQLDAMVGSSSPHPMSRIGCTACHEGVGRRLDFNRATHTPNTDEQKQEWESKYHWHPDHFVDFPMVPSRHIQGQCVKCHLPSVERRPAAEPLARWKVETDKEGNSLVVRAKAPRPHVGVAPVPGTDEEEDAVERLQASVRANTNATAAEKRSRTRWTPDVLERGVETIHRAGCTGCHKIKDFGVTPGFAASTDRKLQRRVDAARGSDFTNPAPGSLTAIGLPKVGPDLTHVRDKTTKEWSMRWIEAPTAFRIDTRMPAFYRHVVHENYVAVPGPNGKHIERTVVLDPDPKDLAQIDVEVLALATFLFDGQRGAIENPYDKGYPEPPTGDAEKGKKIFYSAGCYGCHLGPNDREGGGLPIETLDRFKSRGELPPGPRLTAVGSKVSAKWLYAWLAEPRHYNSVTRMPNMRWRDETGADGKTVVRSADQLRADVVAYLMGFVDREFDAREVPDPAKGVRWTEEHKERLRDMWLEWYGKTASTSDPAMPAKRTLTREEAGQRANDMLTSNLSGMLKDVGFSLVRFRGCFGCHNIEGFEDEQPIGKELTDEGSVDIHKFDFGLLGPPHGHRVVGEALPPLARKGDVMDETRWTWIETKIREPRIFDIGRTKPWNDRLRMPKFNIPESERQAVVSVVLGLVKEPIRSTAKYSWPDDMKKIAAGRAVIERYGCAQCHAIEGRRGVLAGEQTDRGMDQKLLPPNLYGEGNRVKADWLFRFLKQPHDLRPSVLQRMPMFRLNDEEALALVDYFLAVAQRTDRLASNSADRALDETPYAEPVTVRLKAKDASGNDVEREVVFRNEIEEARALFDALACVKCHLPKGTPGADPNEGAAAPPFTLAQPRLQRDWAFDLLHDPQWQIQGTNMPSFWPLKAKRAQKPGDTKKLERPEFILSTRKNPARTPDEVAEAQMDALARYVLWHYPAVEKGPLAAPSEPK